MKFNFAICLLTFCLGTNRQWWIPVNHSRNRVPAWHAASKFSADRTQVTSGRGIAFLSQKVRFDDIRYCAHRNNFSIAFELLMV
jgi:hypothetical protein